MKVLDRLVAVALVLRFSYQITATTENIKLKERVWMEEKEVLDALEAYKAEAIKNAINAFNEGFLLGRQYAEKQFINKEFK